jgi:hypothetical protein
MKVSSRHPMTPYATFLYQPDLKPEPAETALNQAEPAPLQLGKWFTSSIDLRDPAGDQLTTIIVEKIEAARQRLNPRKRARRAVDERNQVQLVRAILANGFACHLHRDPPLVAYRRTSGFYKNEARWLTSGALAQAIDQMASIGFVNSTVGEWGCASSTYSLAQGLLELSERLGVSVSSLTLQLPPKRLVRLRETNSDGPEMAFEQNAETELWAKQLAAYNAFVARHSLAVEPSEWELAGWLKKVNDVRREGTPRLIKPELFKTDLYRTFNNASFDQGGRLYGGWWIDAPKHVRRKVTIDGEPTDEADYSGCAIRMIYHERGIDYRDDPYVIAPLVKHASENNLAPDHYREGVKRLMQALINGDQDGAPERARIDGFTFKPFTRLAVRDMIEQTHPDIADAFGGGSGLRLQRADSDLALTIIRNLMDEGILALPIHDSFLATRNNKSRLITEMNNCYFNKFGYYPIIK